MLGVLALFVCISAREDYLNIWIPDPSHIIRITDSTNRTVQNPTNHAEQHKVYLQMIRKTSMHLQPFYECIHIQQNWISQNMSTTIIIIMIMGDYNIKLKDVGGTVPYSQSYRLNHLLISIFDLFIQYSWYFVGLINKILHVKSHVIGIIFHFYFSMLQ